MSWSPRNSAYCLGSFVMWTITYWIDNFGFYCESVPTFCFILGIADSCLRGIVVLPQSELTLFSYPVKKIKFNIVCAHLKPTFTYLPTAAGYKSKWTIRFEVWWHIHPDTKSYLEYVLHSSYFSRAGMDFLPVHSDLISQSTAGSEMCATEIKDPLNNTTSWMYCSDASRRGSSLAYYHVSVW